MKLPAANAVSLFPPFPRGSRMPRLSSNAKSADRSIHEYQAWLSLIHDGRSAPQMKWESWMRWSRKMKRSKRKPPKRAKNTREDGLPLGQDLQLLGLTGASLTYERGRHSGI